MKNRFRDLEKAIGYRFRRKRWLEYACTHPSYRHENDHAECDNQRLEFLGDAVLGFVAADHLFTAYPDFKEGQMTVIRSQLTNRDTLSSIARELQIDQFLLLGRGEQTAGSLSDSILADALEAIIGAAYIDGGIKPSTRIFNKLFLGRIDERGPRNHSFNPKGNLQEWCQRHAKELPVYRVVNEEGPSHNRTFCLELLIDGQKISEGRGRSRKSAEQQAAARALTRLTAGPDAG